MNRRTPGSRRYANVRSFLRVGQAARDLDTGRLGKQAALARCRCGALAAELWTFGEWAEDRRCDHAEPLPSPEQTVELLRRHARTGKVTKVVLPYAMV